MTLDHLSRLIASIDFARPPGFTRDLVDQAYALMGMETKQLGGRERFFRRGPGAPWQAQARLFDEIGAAIAFVAAVEPEAQVEMRLVPKGLGAHPGCLATVKFLDGRAGIAMREDRELAAAIVSALLRTRRAPLCVDPDAVMAQTAIVH